MVENTPRTNVLFCPTHLVCIKLVSLSRKTHVSEFQLLLPVIDQSELLESRINIKVSKYFKRHVMWGVNASKYPIMTWNTCHKEAEGAWFVRQLWVCSARAFSQHVLLWLPLLCRSHMSATILLSSAVSPVWVCTVQTSTWSLQTRSSRYCVAVICNSEGFRDLGIYGSMTGLAHEIWWMFRFPSFSNFSGPLPMVETLFWTGFDMQSSVLLGYLATLKGLKFKRRVFQRLWGKSSTTGVQACGYKPSNIFDSVWLYLAEVVGGVSMMLHIQDPSLFCFILFLELKWAGAFEILLQSRPSKKMACVVWRNNSILAAYVSKQES